MVDINDKEFRPFGFNITIYIYQHAGGIKIGSRLRIGLLLERDVVPYWAAMAIERIRASEHADIALLILDHGPWDRHRSSSRGSPLYRIHAWYDQARHGNGQDPTVDVGIPPGLERVDRMRLGRREGAPRSLAEGDMSAIKGQDLDVILDIGGVTPIRDLSECSRYGTLSFHPCDGRCYDGRYAGFWEAVDRVPVTGSHVIRVKDGVATVVYRSFSHTITWSEKRNREQVYNKGISFLPRMVEALYRWGEAAIASEERVPLADEEAPSRPAPGNWDILRYVARLAPTNARNIASSITTEEQIAVRYRLGDGIPESFEGFTTLIPPKHLWWADPIVTRQDDDFYIFIEELALPRSRNLGHISVIKVDAEGRYQAPVPVLQRPYHLSYPFVFQHDGRHYMVPESSGARTIELYEAVEFPYRWEHVMDLMKNVHAHDTTLIRRDGRWWMFTNIMENPGAPVDDELFIFHSRDLLSEEWTPHPLNPVVTDVRTARPAGPFCERGGFLYRPSQDCSVCYGYAVNINRVVELSERSYRESLSNRIEPGHFENTTRVHTFSHMKGFTAVDTFFMRSRLRPGR